MVNSQIASLIGQIAQASVEANVKGRHVFVSYSGHVQSLDVRVYGAGWSRGVHSHPHYTDEVYINDYRGEDYVIDKLASMVVAMGEYAE